MLSLSVEFSFTHTDMAWSRPGSWVGYPYYTSPQMWEDVARVAERAGLDMIFFGDGQGIPDTWQNDITGAARYGIEWPRHDHSPFIPLMGRVTNDLGFCLTYSPTYMHPYHIARHISSIQHVVGGPRVGVNFITSARLSDAGNYGYDQLIDHDGRYDRTDEFIEICRKLWASVEQDAIVMDSEAQIFADPSKIHYLNHEGQNWKVRGPLNMLPPPGGDPLIVQAGSSPRGVQSFGRNADVVFAGKPDVAAVKVLRQQLDEHLVANGRDPKETIILWAVSLKLADTRDLAEAQREEIYNSLPMESGGVFLSHKSGFDFSSLPDRFTLGEVLDRIEAAQGSTAYLFNLSKLGRDHELTKEDLCQAGRELMSDTPPAIRGSPTDVADQLEELHEQLGEGFGILLMMRHRMPGTLVDLCEKVIPILRKRGLVRTESRGSLRKNFGLADRSDQIRW